MHRVLDIFRLQPAVREKGDVWPQLERQTHTSRVVCVVNAAVNIPASMQRTTGGDKGNYASWHTLTPLTENPSNYASGAACIANDELIFRIIWQRRAAPEIGSGSGLIWIQITPVLDRAVKKGGLIL